MSKPRTAELEDIIKNLDLHEMVEQDILESSAQDKIDTYDDCVFLIIHFPKYNEKIWKYVSNEMNVILWKDYIITISRNSWTVEDNYYGGSDNTIYFNINRFINLFIFT